MSVAEVVSTGVVMGIVHVLAGPDHLSALATLSGANISSGGTDCDALLLGMRWGVGHSIGLLVVGGTLIAVHGSSADTIGYSSVWSIVLEGFVGVFMLALGFYGIRKAFRNSETGLSGVESVKSGPSSARLSSTFSNATTGNSILLMMTEVLDRDKRRSRETELSSRRFGGNPIDEEGVDDDASASLVNPSTPSLVRARSLVEAHASPEENSSSDEGMCGCFDRFSPALLSIVAGTIHGVAGPGGVLGVIPAIQLQDPALSSAYLGTFCVTSTLVMGLFAALYRRFSNWLAGGKRGGRVFFVEFASACLSIAVGITWLILLSLGKLEEVYPMS